MKQSVLMPLSIVTYRRDQASRNQFDKHFSGIEKMQKQGRV
jgi:hypothetical protein